MKEWFLSIQATYAQAQVALFRNETCVEERTNQNVAASSHLIPLCQDIFSTYNISLDDLQFIAIDHGPGAFTSLRVALATINGVAFARHIPLIGIDSLQALLHQISEKKTEQPQQKIFVSVALLNAYNNDVYYSISLNKDLKEKITIPSEGCCKIDSLLTNLQALPVDAIIFAGNAVAMHQEMINAMLKDKAIIVEPDQLPTARTIGTLGWQSWKRNDAPVYWLDPYYLKTQYFAIRGSP